MDNLSGLGNCGAGMTSVFGRYSSDDVRALIDQYPLGWILPANGPASAGCMLPLLGEYAPDGSLVSLLGHMSRRNTLVAPLSADPQATILFSGPQGYVSPAHSGMRDWGPTWNHAQLAVECVIELQPELTEEAITRLVEIMEPEGQDSWRACELGSRYDAMRESIIGFRASVETVSGRFKLAQDEQPEVLGSILANHPDAALVEWMRRMNKGRV